MTADRDDLDAINRNHADGTPRRLAACAQANPANDDYHPGCCRFPKSCSPYPYAETPVTESDLEPRRDQPPPADRDDLAAILAKHSCISGSHQGKDGMWRVHFVCESSDCGWVGPTGDEGRAAHRAHVAQVVLESDWLRERDAEKWAEGRNAGVTDMTRVIGWGVGGCKPDQMPSDMPNPYRADRVDAEDGGR